MFARQAIPNSGLKDAILLVKVLQIWEPFVLIVNYCNTLIRANTVIVDCMSVLSTSKLNKSLTDYPNSDSGSLHCVTSISSIVELIKTTIGN